MRSSEEEEDEINRPLKASERAPKARSSHAWDIREDEPDDETDNRRRDIQEARETRGEGDDAEEHKAHLDLTLGDREEDKSEPAHHHAKAERDEDPHHPRERPLDHAVFGADE